ncbi:hypothetical protein GGI05_002433 [Coemansia sp. RSA 2603]|nr:hypothetical protein GGI05_002433 [Coemansia sp. RSA 2603]
MSINPRIDRYLATHGVRLTTDASAGHRAVATKAFARGATILSLPPLYLLPTRDGEPDDDDDQATERPPTRCTHCLDMLGGRRARCSQCHAAQYCSARCLAQHWTLRHHLTCRPPSDNTADEKTRRLKPMYRDTLRMLLGVHHTLTCVAQADQRRVPEWMHVQVSAWQHLQTHHARHPKHVLAQYTEISRVSQLDAEGAVDMLCRFGCNNFAAYDWRTGVTPAGHVCSPLASLAFNHACRPTALALVEEGRHVVRALVQIAPGDQITVAYVDALYPRARRQEVLREVYYFACRCGRCAGDSPVARVDALLDRSVPRDALPALLPLDLADPPRGPEQWALRVVDALLDLVLGTLSNDESAFERLAATSVEDTQAADMSFAAYTHWRECQDDCLELPARGPVGLWACIAAHYVLAFYALAYPPFHPLVARQCLRLAQTVAAAMAPGQCAGGDVAIPVDVRVVRRLCEAAERIVRVAGCVREVEMVAEQVRRLRELLGVRAKVI